MQFSNKVKPDRTESKCRSFYHSIDDIPEICVSPKLEKNRLSFRCSETAKVSCIKKLFEKAVKNSKELTESLEKWLKR